MLNCFKKNKDTSNASARVVDGKLILSLPEAQNPVIWQMDLTQTKVSALEIQHNEAENTHALVLKTPSGETIEIAPFTCKSLALEGLMAASHALENADGQIRNTAANDHHPRSSYKKSKTGKKWLIALGCIIGFFVLINIWAGQQPRPPSSSNGRTTASTTESPRQTSGVAVSADDFLNAQ